MSGRLRAEPDRTDFEAHLLTCATCREEVRLGMVVRAELGAPKRGSWWWVGVGAAAAVLILFVARPPFRSNPDGTVKRGGTEGLPAVTAISPAAEAVLPAEPVRFVWHSAGPNVQYRLTVTNQQGDVVWSFGTADTAAVLPASVRVQRSDPYFWYVDALLPDGRSATSRVQRFNVAR
ncbi:MAG TPA: hypothetical protein VK124_05175 [Gemmatimonadales bacterium]|nr:hypothetical protein [Gemmatimonadales bacterium]